MDITTHKNGMLSSNLDSLNDKQRQGIFGTYHQDDITAITVCINGIVVIELHDGMIVCLQVNMVGKVEHL